MRTDLSKPEQDKYLQSRVAFIEAEAKRQEKDALATFGMLEGADPSIAPLRRVLAVWGLTANDIGKSKCCYGSTRCINFDLRRCSIYSRHEYLPFLDAV
jgi:fatty acid synthase subunit alpha